MLAIRQVYNNAPAMIPIPESFRHGNIEVILLLQENDTEVGSEQVFLLLTQLSEDFLLEGRNQLPLQTRDDFWRIDRL